MSGTSQTDSTGVAVKLAAVWAGTLFGIQLSDLVLLATLFYTLLQIGIVLYEKIFRPLYIAYQERKNHDWS
jgi:hypothetical protein